MSAQWAGANQSCMLHNKRRFQRKIWRVVGLRRGGGGTLVQVVASTPLGFFLPASQVSSWKPLRLFKAARSRLMTLVSGYGGWNTCLKGDNHCSCLVCTPSDCNWTAQPTALQEEELQR